MATYRDKTRRWRYRTPVVLPDGRSVRVSGSSPAALNTRAAAEAQERAHVARALEEARAQAAERAAGPEPKEVPRFKDFVQDFMSGYVEAKNKPSERANKRCMIDKHLLPAFGELRLDAIGVLEIDAFRARLRAARLHPKSINNVVGILRRVLTYAELVQLLPRAPRIEALKVDRPPRFDFLDFSELERLLEAASAEPNLLVACMLGSHAGLRRGELIALRWEDIDLRSAKPQLVVRHASWNGIVGTPKGGRPRTVPLSARLFAALRAHRHLNPTVLHREDGSPWNFEVMRFALPRACRRAGLRKIGWHALRHTFCSHLAMRRRDPEGDPGARGSHGPRDHPPLHAPRAGTPGRRGAPARPPRLRNPNRRAKNGAD